MNKKFLNTIPKDKIVRICPFDSVKAKQISDSVLDRIRPSISEVWPVEFYGLSALGIAGQKDIELFLTNPDSPSTKEQLQVMELLKVDRKLLREYEELKSNNDGKSYREHQRAKYKFYNRILGLG